MSRDHLPDRIGVDEAAKENKRNEMTTKDFRLKVQIGDDK